MPNTPTIIKGEVGFLSCVELGFGGKDLFLHINHAGNEYIGCLFIDDPDFRNQVHQFLTECIGMSIKDIGDSDLSHVDPTSRNRFMTEIEKLRQTILDVHGCNSSYVESVVVRDIFQGQVVWEGDVEVFRLIDHPRATLAYAWSYKDDEGKTRYVAVRGIPPVRTALDAVRACIVAQIQKQKRTNI